MKILFLDDIEKRHEIFNESYVTGDEKVYHCYTYREALLTLKNHSPFDVAYLDHDLGDGHLGPTERTGYGVAQYIVYRLDKDKWPKKVIIHSWNPSGAKAMKQVLEKVGIDVVQDPFRGVW